LAEASLRASATTCVPRATSAGINRPPRNPDPPVTNARFMAGNLLASRADGRDPARRWSGRARKSRRARSVAAAQPRPRAGAGCAPDVEHVGLLRAVDL